MTLDQPDGDGSPLGDLGFRDSGGWQSVQACCEPSLWDTHGKSRRLGDYAPKRSRMVLVSGMRFSELPMRSRQREPTSNAVA